MRMTLLFTIGAALAAAVIAQSQKAGAPTFEVASVKVGQGGGPPGDMPRNEDPSPGHLVMTNKPLRLLLEWAYDLKDYQIVGPDWIVSENRYDVNAKAAGPATQDEMRPMLQSLLLERFQMKVHKESREMSVYALVRGKGAPKVTDAPADEQPHLAGNGAVAEFHAFGLWRVAFLLTRRMDRPVLDLTGLKGVYDYKLDLSALGHTVEEANGPSIFSAVDQDLGLKLEGRKAPVEVLVIDHVEKVPTAN